MGKSEICYKYKDGRFLKVTDIGDGDYEIILTKKLTRDCVFENNQKGRDFSFSDLITFCDGIYDDSGKCIDDKLDESDFVIHTVEIKIN